MSWRRLFIAIMRAALNDFDAVIFYPVDDAVAFVYLSALITA